MIFTKFIHTLLKYRKISRIANMEYVECEKEESSDQVIQLELKLPQPSINIRLPLSYLWFSNWTCSLLYLPHQ